uniref:Ribonuclease-III-like protein n=1 Tax=Megaviridae environmental sample TaxID=1737588 RepID=A0A5J6VMC3_9VIRU|nr:MAG: ribonuclease-III-like protein [Megaviridae environmental sample]
MGDVSNIEDVVTTDDGLVFSPFNEKNKEITIPELKSILMTYGIPPKIFNIELYKRAFIHKSYVKRPYLENVKENITISKCPKNCLNLKQKSNERLEFLGDGILELITKFYLYQRFPKENEGFMTEKKIALVKNEAIGRLAYEMKLHNWLIISKHAEEKKTRVNLKKLGCLFEAFLAAMFLDQNKIKYDIEDDDLALQFDIGVGFQVCYTFITTIFERHVDWTNLITNDDNYKNILQVKIQKIFKTTPSYLEIDYSIEEGYTMGVFLCFGEKPLHEYEVKHAFKVRNKDDLQNAISLYENNKNGFIYFSEYKHKIKKKAEQFACKNALEIID